MDFSIERHTRGSVSMSFSRLTVSGSNVPSAPLPSTSLPSFLLTNTYAPLGRVRNTAVNQTWIMNMLFFYRRLEGGEGCVS